MGTQLYVGTSGYSYKEWKGHFYPRDLPAERMLSFYAEHLRAVEINNTFYRMPKRSTLATWAEAVPDTFRFVLKASRRITHEKRLVGAEDPLGYLLDTAGELGKSLGPLLFQLPPFLKKDTARLESFLELLPGGCRAAFEFRHSSWFDDEVLEALRDKGAALCIADSEKTPTPVEATAGWGYLRLRRDGYDEEGLHHWVERVRAQDWEEVFVFFKHEEAGAGPRLAKQFAELFDPDPD